ncbi:XRE family transcriptional regulator [Mycolicibacterium frederiksbergense]|uniref:XRE family transcriptional regulator n=1 Tax=Mycolicibacterium frederiksbergense TaxID=117567 RepID=UPI00265B8220|nr:XRE family transcriptional regulator [Mycolicibacterium frederiksbergense]MDO0975980.1 XRE family transcriptional regulator [Mycolicibacterium frederiksbergense]
MPDEPKALTKNPLGPSGVAVAANVERLRKELGLTYAALSEMLDKIGRPIPPLGLRKIVGETRRVDSDDLVGLAMALGVSPTTLLMPGIESAAADDPVAITGSRGKELPAKVVWDWLAGRNRITRVRFSDFTSRSWPTWERQALWMGAVERQHNSVSQPRSPEEELLMRQLFEQARQELSGELLPEPGAM